MLVRFEDAACEPLFRDLSLTVKKGEIIAVLGPNGVGKTTFLNTIVKTQPLTHGTVEVHGRLGYIPQQQMFDRTLPVRARDLVSLAVEHRALRKAARRDVDKLLERVGATAFANKRVGELSGGQQQLIRQAQALANDPEILLADEPFLSLDTSRVAQFVRTVQNLQEHGTATIMVTHTVEPIRDMIDRVLYVDRSGHHIGPLEEGSDSHDR